MSLTTFSLTLALLLLASIGSLTAAELQIRCPAVAYDIRADFNVADHTVSGVETMTVAGGNCDRVGFLVNTGFAVVRCKVNGTSSVPQPVEAWLPEEISPEYGKYSEWDPAAASLWTARIPYKHRPVDTLFVEIAWKGSLYEPPDNRQFSREKIAFEVNGTIGEEGIFLSPSVWWYPRLPDCLATHRLVTHLPPGWNGVSAGDPSWTETVGGVEVTHVSTFPLDGLNFSANRFQVDEVEANHVRIMTYFLPNEADLVPDYLKSSQHYIEMYSEMLGAYPFPKFAVVDNFLPSGYGMPGWTLLGSEVLQLPFIRYTSLGHEILHNWFGNSLLVDYRGGNWCEGLTVYLADHLYKAQQSPQGGVEYRRDVLRDYAAYVNQGNEYALTDFVAREESSDRAIGYGKSMMVFHMLQVWGDQRDTALFLRAVRDMAAENTGKAVSWSDWQTVYERVYKEKLGWFFDQWVRGLGAPLVSLDKVELDQSRSKWRAKLILSTIPSGKYRFILPVQSINDAGITRLEWFDVSISPQEIILKGKGRLTGLQLDPQFDVFRQLYPAEIPATFAGFFGNPEGVFVVKCAEDKRDGFLKVAEGLKSEAQTIAAPDEKLAKETSRWLIGNWTTLNRQPELAPYLEKVLSLLPEGSSDAFPDDVTANVVFPLEGSPNALMALSVCGAAADPVVGTRKLVHYGKYSFVVFAEGKAVNKGILPPSGVNPLEWKAK